MSVRMTNCGPLGWVTDKERGYRYQADASGDRQALAADAEAAARSLAGGGRLSGRPEACLVNYYAGGAKMGLHQDKDEEDFAAPVLSVSLGDTRHLPRRRRHAQRPNASVELKSGDVVVLGGEDRLAFHGIDRILPGTSDLLPRAAGSI